jgi:hypothetical protein
MHILESVHVCVMRVIHTHPVGLEVLEFHTGWVNFVCI